MSKNNKKNKTKGNIFLDSLFIEENKKKINEINVLWNMFRKNKEWIMSFLFASSFVHSIVYYGLYGINILEFYSLSDYFINFAQGLVPFIVLIPLAVLFFLLPEGKSYCLFRFTIVIKLLLFLVSVFFVSLIFQGQFSLLTFLFIAILFYLFYKQNKIVFTWFFIVYILLFSFLIPIEKRIIEKGNTSLIERVSFSYDDKEYDLSKTKYYYYIGSCKDYFFIHDNLMDKVDILPKGGCRNISRNTLSWNELWKSDNLHNPKVNINRRFLGKRTQNDCKKRSYSD